ncbi:uncharacterized protein [Heterodontus francisci]|uniref:uncharacterized protein n=1 Tax=Heterodontus francisci TaxID=7792 RepID=UPI00355C589C
MAAFEKPTGGYTAADAGLYGNFPQPPPYGLSPPPYSEISPPYASVLQRDGTSTSTGYHSNYPSCAPYPQYPINPTAPQLSYAPPQYADYQKSFTASSTVFAPQSTGAAAPPPILPYFVNQQHCAPTYVVNQQHCAPTYVINQQHCASTYVVNQQHCASTYVVNQQHPGASVVVMQSVNTAKGNPITRGYPTAKFIQQSSKSLAKGLATSVLSQISSNPRNKGKQVTIITGGNNMIIHK